MFEETQKTELLQVLKEFTINGRLVWKAVSPDHYLSNIGDEEFRVEFQYYLRSDESGSDRLVASLSAFSVITDCAVGTYGFDEIMEILTFSNAEIMSWRSMTSKRIDEGLRKLKNMG